VETIAMFLISISSSIKELERGIRVASCFNCRNNVLAHYDDRATAWNVKQNEAGMRWRLQDMFPSRNAEYI
jgi:hypothetical protein